MLTVNEKKLIYSQLFNSLFSTFNIKLFLNHVFNW